MTSKETESFTSFAIIKLEEAKQILLETETLRTNVVPVLRQEQKELEARVHDVRQQLEALRAHLKTLRETKQIMETEIQEAKTRETEALHDLPSIRAERQQLETKIQKSKHEAEGLRVILLDLAEQKQESDRKLEAQNMNLKRLQAEKSDLETDIQEAKKAYESLHKEIATLKEEHLGAKHKTGRIRNEILALRDEKQKLETHLQTVKQALVNNARNKTNDKRNNNNEEADRTQIDDRHSRSHLPQTDTHKSNYENSAISEKNLAFVVTFGDDCSMFGNGDDDDELGNQKEKGMEQSVDSTTNLTDVSNALFSLSSPKKRLVHRASSSPKKWRRMIRTHRLRSILLDY